MIANRYQMGYPHSLCMCNVFSSVSTCLTELCEQPDQVLILLKTTPFSFLGLIFFLSFGSLGNQKNTSVYRRKVAGVCNWRRRRDCPFWEKHGLRSIL